MGRVSDLFARIEKGWGAKLLCHQEFLERTSAGAFGKVLQLRCWVGMMML
jgi:hypothetical protein